MKYSVLALMGLLTVTGLNAAPHALTASQEGAESETAYPTERVYELEAASEQVASEQITELRRIRPDAKAARPQKVQKRLAVVKPCYEVEMQATTANRWAAIRYDANTGKSWRMMDSTWLPIKEVKQLRPRGHSDYIVKIDHTVNERYCALRMDLQTGQCWALKEGTWTPILEEEE